MMLWVVQSNLLNGMFDDLIRELGSECAAIEVQPDQASLTISTKNAIAFGSVQLARIARNEGWSPGVFYNDQFSHAAWANNWRERYLNFDAEEVAIIEADFLGARFVRPSSGMKSFSGQFTDGSRFKFWREQLLKEGLPERSKIVLSEIRAIRAEWRCFIVAGEVVTGSQYRFEGRTVYGPLPDVVRQFAQAQADLWLPHQECVIDIAELASGGFRIVEANCINTSGLYHSDLTRLIGSLKRRCLALSA